MSLPVSDNWKSAIEARFRDQGYLRIIISVVPPGIREGEVVSTDSINPLTNVDTIGDGVPDNIEPIVTLEEDRWIGDGSQYLPSANPAENAPVECWDEHDVHDDDTYTSYTFEFDQTYDIPGIFGVWDTQTNSWPTKVIIEGYNNVDALIDSYTITNITTVQAYCDAPFVNCKKVVVRIKGWSKNGWRARVTEIMFGLYLNFDTSKITNASSSSTVSLTGEELPVCTMDVTLGNYTGAYDPMLIEGYSKFLKVKQIATKQWGFKLPSGIIKQAASQKMFLTNIDIPSDSATFNLSFGTRLDFLTSDYVLGDFTGADKSLGAIAEEILNNSDLIRQTAGETPYELCDTLYGINSNAPIPVMAPNKLLQYIANAAGCILNTRSTNGYIRIHDLDPADEPRVARNITRLQQLGDPAITVEEQLYTIKISVYTYALATSVTEVYNGSFVLSGTTTVEVEYNNDILAKNASVTSITNGTVNTATFYGRKARLTITPTDINMAVGIVISGYEITQNVTYIETYRDATLDRGLEIEIDNPFITNTAYLTTLTNILKAYYQKRQTITAPYTGYPEIEGADAVTIISKYGTANGDVEESNIDYNGGWSGTLTARVGDGT